MHGENSGCTVLREVHPVGAQNKTLISDTAEIKSMESYFSFFLSYQGLPGYTK